jgi:hypothetical protein
MLFGVPIPIPVLGAVPGATGLDGVTGVIVPPLKPPLVVFWAYAVRMQAASVAIAKIFAVIKFSLSKPWAGY